MEPFALEDPSDVHYIAHNGKAPPSPHAQNDHTTPTKPRRTMLPRRLFTSGSTATRRRSSPFSSRRHAFRAVKAPNSHEPHPARPQCLPITNNNDSRVPQARLRHRVSPNRSCQLAIPALPRVGFETPSLGWRYLPRLRPSLQRIRDIHVVRRSTRRPASNGRPVRLGFQGKDGRDPCLPQTKTPDDGRAFTRACDTASSTKSSNDTNLRRNSTDCSSHTLTSLYFSSLRKSSVSCP